MMWPTLLAVLAAQPVVVVGLEGSASPELRARTHTLLVEALRGVEGLSVVALPDPSAMLGPDTQARWRACADDACRVALLGAVVRGDLVLGALEARSGGGRLELRVVTASTAVAITRVSRDVSTPLDRRLPAVVLEAAGQLFPARRLVATAPLTVIADEGAELTLDGRALGRAPVPTQAVPLGEHTVVAALPDGRRAEASVVLELGTPQSLTLSLGAARTAWPWLVAGGAVALAGGGLGLGLVADATASDWSSACPAGERCAAGYTRERYDADADAVALHSGLSTGLWIGAGVALTAAVVWWIIEGQP